MPYSTENEVRSTIKNLYWRYGLRPIARVRSGYRLRTILVEDTRRNKGEGVRDTFAQ